ncbi:ubiquitin carboxyl-terminal hydrolase [Xylaria flabelliformis]|nr:ubiquitin carboxyl-terminal hydrolase [Xylaria flabelliformis]
MAALEENHEAMSTTNPDDLPIVNGIRRSSRAKRVPLKYDEEVIIPAEKSNQAKTITTKAPRPKRSAADAARERMAPEEVVILQEEVFARMDIDERKEYRGWVELESEPAFFNAMLQDLDAKTLTVQEVVALDKTILAELPDPVYGLIFLYEWTNEDESHEARQDCPANLWFGNQTTANACATVALMNIIMNAHGVKFGPELEEFRHTTKPLPPPHRGHALDTNDFIRTIHNSVARRNDLLSEDLLLDNKLESASKRRAAPAKKRQKTSNSSKRNNEPSAYHYIAFVPVDGQVWELDGLESLPLCLGPYAPDDTWLNLASEAIQNRMARQDDAYPSFNLLAICQSPLLTFSQSLARNLAIAKALDFSDIWKGFSDERLARFGLNREQILAEFSPPSPDDAQKRTREELRTEIEALEARYVEEEATVHDAVDMIRARQRDYTPAVHQWVRILADKGVLRELIQETDSLG